MPLYAPSIMAEYERIGSNGNVHFLFESRKRRRTPYETALETSDTAQETALRVGTCTTRHNKPTMIAYVRRLLEERRLQLYDDFVVARPDEQPPDEDAPRETLVRQLRMFQRIVEYPKTRSSEANVAPKIIYSGKSGGGRDDFVMALAIAVFAYVNVASGVSAIRAIGRT